MQKVCKRKCETEEGRGRQWKAVKERREKQGKKDQLTLETLKIKGFREGKRTDSVANVNTDRNESLLK